ncbi:ethanolamine transporter [Geomicrobium halophilum]|uniref:Ethanolamine transporter n=1 Tax=Geomicrobium halophilum TaxID=549000 RepID=A0A841Q0F3_9BACL|nr:ethanolamine utilization protein EutH [Geomicrobium halophilum]MBB6450942.1 ethanolamine transporter [Geomicrobium halophilum]
MDINQVILFVMILSLTVSAVDYIFGSQLGIGTKFLEAFRMMGPLALVIVGIVTIAPLLASGIEWVSTPLHETVGIDPAALINTFLAIDMGGHALAVELADNEATAAFAWVFLGTIYGPALSFTVPAAMGLLQKEDVPFFARGILMGLVCAPLGCFIGGLVAGLPVNMMLLNLMPAMVFSVVIGAGLIFYQEATVKIFTFLGRAVTAVAVIGIILLSIETLLPFASISGLTPLSEGMTIIGQIVLVLAGAFPLVYMLSRGLEQPLQRVGDRLGMNAEASAGLLAALAHAIPAFAMFSDMNERGKTIVAAFCVSGAFVLGGHLGFVAGVDANYVFAMVIGKLTGGMTAVTLAWVVTREKIRQK